MSGKRSVTADSGPRLPVLYDGWPLAYAPYSASALHLLELFEALPAGVEPWVALPLAGQAESIQSLLAGIPLGIGDQDGLSTGFETMPEQAVSPICSPVRNSPGGRLYWEQQALPHFAREIQARWIHTSSLSAPLFSPAAVMVSPADNASKEAARPGFLARVQASFGRGGQSVARVILWPTDLPEPVSTAPVQRITPYVHSAFFQPQPRAAGLPEQYVLVPGPLDARGTALTAAAWSWASAGLGEDWALVAANLDASNLADLRDQCGEIGLQGAVMETYAATPWQRASLFQNAAAILITGQVLPWGDSLLQALVCARPLVAENTTCADARVGPAGFLTSPGDARALGAALLTAVIDEPVAAQLSQSARERSNQWNQKRFRQQLGEIYAQWKTP